MDRDCTRMNRRRHGEPATTGDLAQMMTSKRIKRLRIPSQFTCRAMTSQAQSVLQQDLTSRARGHDDAARAGPESRHRDLWLDPGTAPICSGMSCLKSLQYLVEHAPAAMGGAML